MIRGVSCALASCTATSRMEKTKTMNVSMDEASAPSTARAPSGPTTASSPGPGPPGESPDSSTSAATMPSTGGSQTEFLRKLLTR